MGAASRFFGTRVRGRRNRSTLDVMSRSASALAFASSPFLLCFKNFMSCGGNRNVKEKCNQSAMDVLLPY